MTLVTPRDHPAMGVFRRAGIAAALVVAASCGGPSESVDPGADSAHFEKQLTAFRDRLASLEERQVATDEVAARSARRLGRRLERLRGTVARLQAAVQSARGDVAGAVAEVQTVKRELSLLTERYDFHMRRYHGGR